MTYKGLVLPVRSVTIASQVEGRVEMMEIREGDLVEEGALLLSLYAGMEKLEVKRSAAAVEKREFEFQSSKSLFEEKVISEDEALQSRIELDLAQFTLEMAQERVEQRRLKSPISGMVVERQFEVGEMVRPAEPILEVVDLTEVFVQFYAQTEDLAVLKVGQSASVTVLNLGLAQAFTGPIDFIDPRVDAASGLARVRVRLQNPEGAIKAGVRAEVTLTEESEAPAE